MKFYAVLIALGLAVIAASAVYARRDDARSRAECERNHGHWSHPVLRERRCEFGKPR